MLPIQITQQNVDQIQYILDSGNRAGAYLYYYELIKTYDADAAWQILIQAQITSYSGFFGGAALIGNALAKHSNPTLYNLSLDEFSRQIVQGLVDNIQEELDLGGDGVLSRTQIQESDRDMERKGAGGLLSRQLSNVSSRAKCIALRGYAGGCAGGFATDFWR